MKRLCLLAAVLFAVACNSGENNTEGQELDSATNSNTEKNYNDNPMRNRDTTTNLMEDTMKGFNDSMQKR